MTGATATTPLPEPVMAKQYPDKSIGGFWNAEQMREYGAAEYRRGIEDAAKLCMDLNHGWCSDDAMTCAAEIRLLGEAK